MGFLSSLFLHLFSSKEVEPVISPKTEPSFPTSPGLSAEPAGLAGPAAWFDPMDIGYGPESAPPVAPETVFRPAAPPAGKVPAKQTSRFPFEDLPPPPSVAESCKADFASLLGLTVDQKEEVSLILANLSEGGRSVPQASFIDAVAGGFDWRAAVKEGRLVDWSEFADESARLETLRLAVACAFLDGGFNDREFLFLEKTAASLNLTPTEVESLVESFKQAMFASINSSIRASAGSGFAARTVPLAGTQT